MMQYEYSYEKVVTRQVIAANVSLNVQLQLINQS